MTSARCLKPPLKRLNPAKGEGKDGTKAQALSLYNPSSRSFWHFQCNFFSKPLAAIPCKIIKMLHWHTYTWVSWIIILNFLTSQVFLSIEYFSTWLCAYVFQYINIQVETHAIGHKKTFIENYNWESNDLVVFLSLIKSRVIASLLMKVMRFATNQRWFLSLLVYLLSCFIYKFRVQLKLHVRSWQNIKSKR